MTHFKVGDKIVVYSLNFPLVNNNYPSRVKGEIKSILDDCIISASFNVYPEIIMHAHPKQCRLLYKKGKIEVGDEAISTGRSPYRGKVTSFSSDNSYIYLSNSSTMEVLVSIGNVRLLKKGNKKEKSESDELRMLKTQHKILIPLLESLHKELQEVCILMASVEYLSYNPSSTASAAAGKIFVIEKKLEELIKVIKS